MEDIICTECKGRKFRKLNNSEYECEYCGAIIKDTSASNTPKVVIVQQSNQPKAIVTPFPAEVSYAANLNEGFNNSPNGRIIIHPDKFIFKPNDSIYNRGNLSPREWRIIDISGYINGAMKYLDIKMNNGKVIHLYSQQKKRILSELEERRKYWAKKQVEKNSSSADDVEMKRSAGNIILCIICILLFIFFMIGFSIT